MEFQVLLNGAPVEGLLHASIVTGNCFSSDSYVLTLAMGSFPLADIAFWSSVSIAYVEIGLTSAYQLIPYSLISGMIDAMVIDPIRQTVVIEGRDLSASLIDFYRQQDFVNQSASEVVSTIASYHGLTPIITATSGEVGRYYGDGYTRLSLGQFSRLRSDWDLVVQLARENSFDIFVQGTTLFFQPSTSLTDIPVHISLHDVSKMRFDRALAMASQATARVQSWDSRNVSPYVSNASGSGAGGAQSTGPGAQPFLFSASNLTSQQVMVSAERYAAELVRLSVVLHLEMPWDLTLSPRTQILIDETGSQCDTIYKIDTVERHYSTTSGSSQTIRAVIL
jgi:hypothetical protein